MDTLHGEWDPYYVLSRYPSGYPADITAWLNAHVGKIGVDDKITWVSSSKDIFANFLSTGQCGRRVCPILHAR